MDYRQIQQLKAQYPDALLFTRIGDFYEAFGTDALTLSKELDLVLTGREMRGAPERVPMTGVPFHTLDSYVAKLIANGHKVAIAENTAEPVKQVPAAQENNTQKENQHMEPNVNTTPYTEDRRAEIVSGSKELLNELLKTGNLKKLLCAVGRNGRYTLNNTLFMLAHKPDLTVVKNMADWNELGRQIIPDSQSLEIMSPIKEEKTVEPKEGEEPQYDENGQPIVKKYTATTGFKPTYVFDVSQTAGKEYAPFKLTAKVSDEEKRVILKGVRHELGKRGYGIEFVDAEKLAEGENGRVNRKDKKVEIKKGMDNFATALTLLHTSGAALSGAMKYRDFEGLKGDEASMLEASCTDCILSAHFGMDTENFDFSYTAAWDESERTAFYHNANLVCLSATRLMEGVDHAFEYNRSVKQEQGAAASTPASRPSLFRGAARQSEAVAT